MTVHKSAGRRLDLVALRRAIELRDLDTMLGFYAQDAQVRVLNGDIPQSPPFELRGKAEIAGYLRALCDGDTTRRVGNGVANEKRIAFSETCEYPNETRIVVHTTLELREGKIVGQVDVVVREAREEAGEGSARGNREEEETIGRRAFDRVPIENLHLRRRSRDFSDSFEKLSDKYLEGLLIRLLWWLRTAKNGVSSPCFDKLWASH